jgi:hypothetical protein
MEQMAQGEGQHVSECAELDYPGPTLAPAENTADPDRHWWISPAWHYAIAIFKRLENERLRC